MFWVGFRAAALIRWLRFRLEKFAKLVSFLSTGKLALILHCTDSVPMSKNLWSLSFCFICSSICFLVFTGLFVVIELQNYWSGYPFAAVGQNALFLYLGECAGPNLMRLSTVARRSNLLLACR